MMQCVECTLQPDIFHFCADPFACLTASLPLTDSAQSEVRLSSGFTDWDGRVEVLHEKQWGSVCASGWSLVDASVSCAAARVVPPRPL